MRPLSGPGVANLAKQLALQAARRQGLEDGLASVPANRPTAASIEAMTRRIAFQQLLREAGYLTDADVEQIEQAYAQAYKDGAANRPT